MAMLTRQQEAVVEVLVGVGISRGVAYRLVPFLAQLANATTTVECDQVLLDYHTALQAERERV